MSKLKKMFLFIPHSFSTLFGFLKEVKSEMKKVKWPNGKEMRQYTLVVISITAIITLYFLGLDYAIEFVKGLIS